ncbi:type IV secretory pathway VirD4 protein-like protein [Catenulispora acidiphila DSM 44928]|uniref:Type IV secretory pathway VirD4 protein-like protein n=1 Tax=Catenulispora acidiphila (strain DSM 44928 / JCM 14897 / NBRC 102108 / NRRL B-24433 / ID139908) TaxID=479433 RepID=C7PYS7_CATAD|nr:TraM recognition domain-containing protein [Catenulispora acidiphila]ACU77399.1 type IV secretory pathway VirD4 protein-like protein [Catenulispora acidiphila DSM 44928]
MSAPNSSLLGRWLLHPTDLFSLALASAEQSVCDWWLIGVPMLGTASCSALACWYLKQARRHRAVTDASARYVILKLPPEVEPGCAEAFWTHLHALLRPRWQGILDRQPHLAFEFLWSSEGLSLGVWVPPSISADVMATAAEAAWPGVYAQIVSPAPIPITAQASTCGRLRLAKPSYLPLKVKHTSDPLRPLLQAGRKLRPSESACVQILARPAAGRRVRQLQFQLNRFRARTFRDLGTMTPVSTFLDEWTPNAKPQTGPADPAHAAALRSAVTKTVGPLWAVEIRYAAGTESTGPDADKRTRSITESLASAFGVFAERNSWARHRLTGPPSALASRRMGRGDLLTVAELAGIAHLPLDADVVGVPRAGARSIAPPPEIPALSHGHKILGDADTSPIRPVSVAVPDARQHFHIMGATNSGKSTLMARMILDDVDARRGVLVLDPKGDLVGDLLDRLPLSAADRLVLIDPTDSGPPPCLNILAQGDPELTVDNLVGIFRRLFASSWGPRTDDVLRAACLTLLATARDRPPTLADVSQLLSDKVFRTARTASLAEGDHRMLDHFWTGFADLSAQSQAAITAPLQNKLRAFLLRRFVADVIAQPRSTIDLGRVLDGGICLVRLPKGVLGDDTMRLLGSFILAAAWHATTARAGRPEQARPDASVYLDEAHNFLNLPYSLEDMLAEARAYRVSFTLAHQNLAQLPTDLAEGISANARNKVFFTCSPQDARALAAHVGPLLGEHDLAHLDAFQAAARLTAKSAHVRAFTMRTRPAQPAIPGRADAIRAAVHAAARGRA